MNDNSTKRIRVLKSEGVLTPRVEAIISHYTQQGVDVRSVLQRERLRLSDKLVLMACFGEEDYAKLHPNEDSMRFIQAKIKACDEILSVINS